MALESAAAVIEALGGTAEVAKLTGRKYTAAHNWKQFDRFPANTYLTIHCALKQRGLKASPILWGMLVDAKAHTAPKLFQQPKRK